jgi:hypothetical protein
MATKPFVRPPAAFPPKYTHDGRGTYTIVPLPFQCAFCSAPAVLKTCKLLPDGGTTAPVYVCELHLSNTLPKFG